NQLPLAIADLDIIRARAGLTKIASTNPNTSQSDLLDAILKERRSELFTEWGHRWMDLRRFGKLDAVMSAIKPGWKPAAQLLPIPYSEILVNQNLKQNPGY
ncbi:MAG: RagB/SusD family nutrient uptake outer membrane protein, partial [Chitinophagaceae bacterium]